MENCQLRSLGKLKGFEGSMPVLGSAPGGSAGSSVPSLKRGGWVLPALRGCCGAAAELLAGETFSGAASPLLQHGHPRLRCQKTSELPNHALVGFVG